MKLIKLTFASVVVFLMSVVVFAQKDFEGVITYGLTYKNLPEEMAGMESMLPQQSVVYMSKDLTRMDQEMGMGGKMVVMTNSETKENRIYMDMMGQKLEIEVPKEEIEKEEAKQEEVDIAYDNDETMEIEGYTCKKAVITAEGQEIIAYYTEEIPVNEANDQLKNLKGFPLYYEMQQQGMTIIVKATEIKKGKVSKDKFEAMEGYTKMDYEQFKQTMGGM